MSRALIEPLLPASDGYWGRPFRDNRRVVEGAIGQAPAPIALVSDNGPCFRSSTFPNVRQQRDRPPTTVTVHK